MDIKKLALIFGLSVSQTIGAANAQSAYQGPAQENIQVTNNAQDKSDTIKVTNLTPRDEVRVYRAATGGALLGIERAKDSVVIVSVSQLGKGSGSVYVSVARNGNESKRTYKNYPAEKQSNPLEPNNVSITSVVSSKAYIIEVFNLSEKDIVKVYSSFVGGKLLGSVSEIKGRAFLSLPQSGVKSGTVHLTVTSAQKNESSRISKKYKLEKNTLPIKAENITVINNITGNPDIILVSKLTKKDFISVYDKPEGGKLIATAVEYKGSAKVTVEQLGVKAGTVYISVKSTGRNESIRTKKRFEKEPISKILNTDLIEINNFIESYSDKITVNGLNTGDIVKVYDSFYSKKEIGIAKADSSGKVIIEIAQLGTDSGILYISRVSKDMLESERVAKKYDSEVSISPSENNISVINNSEGISDRIIVSNVKSGDFVNVYDSQSKKIAGVRAASETATIEVSQLGSAEGHIFLSVTSEKKQESPKVRVDYPAELIVPETKTSSTITYPVNPITDSLRAEMISVSNLKYWTTDTVVVNGLTSGEIVRVYNSLTGYGQLGTAIAAGSAATVMIQQLGTYAGSVYVTVEEPDKNESERVEKAYGPEPVTAALSSGDIYVSNNTMESDSVYINGLTSGAIVRVYNNLGSLLGTATSMGDFATVFIAQLGTQAGSVYVSVEEPDKLESEYIECLYSAEED